MTLSKARSEGFKAGLAAAIKAIRETEIVESGKGYSRSEDARATLLAAEQAVSQCVPLLQAVPSPIAGE